LTERAAKLPKDQPVAVICAGGFRSSIGTSILERQGFTRVTNVIGGMAAWKTANLDVAA
jgi:hydroxyacylglutathione hydrolase